jgi:hypothetical protein
MKQAKGKKGYDVIGDVHGHADKLTSLLVKLGYRRKGDAPFVHPANRQAIFVGDLINRGPKVRTTLQIVREMEKVDSCRVILGNHEFNLLGMETTGRDGEPLRPRSPSNLHQIKNTRKSFQDFPKEWKAMLKWLRKLPLSLELTGLRIVHAAWHPPSLKVIAGRTFEDEDFLENAFSDKKAEAKAVKITLKGIKVDLPKGKKNIDRFGVTRNKARIRWWSNPCKKSFRELLFPPFSNVSRKKSPMANALKIVVPYPKRERPVFFGHYCLPEEVPKINGNTTCVDGCVTCDGKLWAYQFDGEKIPSENKLVHAG